MYKGGTHMGVRTLFYSVVLDGDVKFSKAANGCDTASFCVKYGNEKYRMILFSDQNEKNPYTRMKTCVEKGALTKGKPLWIEAEMTYYEKSIIPDESWNELISDIPNEKVEQIFGSTKNPSKGKFPRFKVTEWDFAIPKECHDTLKPVSASSSSGYETKEPSSSMQPTIKPLGLENWGNSGI